jgi:hypothetical protein
LDVRKKIIFPLIVQSLDSINDGSKTRYNGLDVECSPKVSHVKILIPMMAMGGGGSFKR